MSRSFFPVLETEDAGIETHVIGKAMARDEARLSRLAENAGGKPLLEFFSVASEDVTDLIDDESLEIAPVTWFSAEDGLVTVRALRDALLREAREGDRHLLEDLSSLEHVLVEASAKGLRWHLAIDY